MAKRKIQILLLFVGMLLISVLGIFSSAADSCSYHAQAYQGLDLTKLSHELEHTGLIGRVHGAASPSQLYVMSVREPKNFFNYRHFSVLAKDDSIQEQLSQVKRHDRICIQGEFIPNPSPQKHILVRSLKVLDQWSGLAKYPDYEREADLPSELIDKTSLVGKVHAIGADGRILVIEYKDGVAPIFVQSPDYTKDLFRGDIVRLAYRIQSRPQRPTHLNLDLDAEPPLEVLDKLADWNGQPKSLTGHLVKFPQSPQLNFDVYAMEVETQGVNRYFTLVNFDSLEEFERIRIKLGKIWDDHSDTVISGRNMLINPEVTIEAIGQANVVSPAQANPQILLNSANNVQLKTE